MAGLIQEQMRQPQQSTEQAPEQPQQTQPEQGQESPALRVVLAAMKIMYEKTTSDGVVKMLRRGAPVEALAKTTLFILQILQTESKGSIPQQVMLEAVEPILGLLAELSVAAGAQLTPEMADQAKQFVMEQLQKAARGERPRGQAPQQPMRQQSRPPMQRPQQAQGLIAGAMA